MYRRTLAFFLALILFLGTAVGAIPVRAESNDLLVEDLHINPLYQDTFSESDLVPFRQTRAASDADYTDSVEDIALTIRENMKARQESIPLCINTPDTDGDVLKAIVNEAFALAISHTGVPTEGDYLKWQYGGWNYSGNGHYADDGSVNWDIPFTLTYYTTAAQEQTVTTEINKLLNQLDVDSASDYEKLSAVYDYICANITYDYANLEDDSYMLKYTAYAALIDGTAVCQGYALLLYRLALELDVDARLIAGDGGGPHGWNIAQLNGLYYNLDSTWDAGNTRYRYFLVCPDNFTDHVRYAEFDSAEFHAAYPMDDEDFDPSGEVCTHSYTSSVTREATCTAAGVTTYTCSKCGNSYTETIAALGHSEVTDKGYSATCTETGMSDGSHCSRCNAVLTEQKTIPALGHSWDNGKVTKQPTETETGIRTYTCTACGETRTEEIPCIEMTADVVRISGKGRCETAIAAADALKEALNADRFDTIILSSGSNFADALTGSYLAAAKNAPILLHFGNSTETNLEYIQNNLSKDGVIYILGGTAAVPAEVETALTEAGFTVERVKGKTRFDTNLAILEKAGITGEEILVTTGWNFADSLSVSATGLPILMVDTKKNELTDAQIAFLAEHAGSKITIIGGTGAVSKTLENAITEITGSSIRRIYGKTREDTSVAVANTYFGTPKYAFVAYSQNFPDGLCGGPLAYAMNAPLLLINKGTESAAAAYVDEHSIRSGYVLGGTGVVSDASVEAVFG